MCVCVLCLSVFMHACVLTVYIYVWQSENIKLDPDLQEACNDDVRKLCAKTEPGNAAVSLYRIQTRT